MNSIISSVSYIEFLNKITSLSNDLLYNPQSGFLMQKSKDAVLGFCEKIKKFEYEVSKITKDVSFSNLDEIVDNKKQIFSNKLLSHARQELFRWIDEVFQDFIENSLFETSINKQNANYEKNNILSALDWYCRIKKYDKKAYIKMFNELNIRFEHVLNSSDDDYLPKKNSLKTNESEFLKIWDLTLENEDEFLNYDLDSKLNLLTQEDANYFQKLKNNFNSSKKNSIKDDIVLINTSIKIAKIDDKSKKYDFIKQILNDFSQFIEQNKTISEEDKIKLIKRRMKLFLNKETKTSSYFEKLLLL